MASPSAGIRSDGFTYPTHPEEFNIRMTDKGDETPLNVTNHQGTSSTHSSRFQTPIGEATLTVSVTEFQFSSTPSSYGYNIPGLGRIFPDYKKYSGYLIGLWTRAPVFVKQIIEGEEICYFKHYSTFNEECLIEIVKGAGLEGKSTGYHYACDGKIEAGEHNAQQELEQMVQKQHLEQRREYESKLAASKIDSTKTTPVRSQGTSGPSNNASTSGGSGSNAATGNSDSNTDGENNTKRGKSSSSNAETEGNKNIEELMAKLKEIGSQFSPEEKESIIKTMREKPRASRPATDEEFFRANLEMLQTVQTVHQTLGSFSAMVDQDKYNIVGAKLDVLLRNLTLSTDVPLPAFLQPADLQNKVADVSDRLFKTQASKLKQSAEQMELRAEMQTADAVANFKRAQKIKDRIERTEGDTVTIKKGQSSTEYSREEALNIVNSDISSATSQFGEARATSLQSERLRVKANCTKAAGKQLSKEVKNLKCNVMSASSSCAGRAAGQLIAKSMNGESIGISDVLSVSGTAIVDTVKGTASQSATRIADKVATQAIKTMAPNLSKSVPALSTALTVYSVANSIVNPEPGLSTDDAVYNASIDLVGVGITSGTSALFTMIPIPGATFAGYFFGAVISEVVTSSLKVVPKSVG